MSADWTFARRPFWVFSHLFALTVVVLFVLLGFWQLSRHSWRAALNDEIESRSSVAAIEADEALRLPTDELDYRSAIAHGTYVDGDLVRVANRSQDGAAGEHVVGLFRLDDGQLLLVNRGFVPVNTEVDVLDPPAGPVTLSGSFRATVTRGWLGATDTGQGDLVPRMDIDAIAQRVDESLAPVWLQLAPADDADPAAFPAPVPLPDLDGGPHLSYMAQWFIFATLGTAFYLAVLRRRARQDGKRLTAATTSTASTSASASV